MGSSSVLVSHPLTTSCLLPSSNVTSLPLVSPCFASLSSASSSNILLLSGRPLLTISPIATRRPRLPCFSVFASSDKQKKKVLIVNTNSGGHAVIGFYLSKDLLTSGHSVTILTVGDEGSDKMKKPPFNRFSVSYYLPTRKLPSGMRKLN